MRYCCKETRKGPELQGCVTGDHSMLFPVAMYGSIHPYIHTQLLGCDESPSQKLCLKCNAEGDLLWIVWTARKPDMWILDQFKSELSLKNKND